MCVKGAAMQLRTLGIEAWRQPGLDAGCFTFDQPV
jgi:hypothetical protein